MKEYICMYVCMVWVSIFDVSNRVLFLCFFLYRMDGLLSTGLLRKATSGPSRFSWIGEETSRLEARYADTITAATDHITSHPRQPNLLTTEGSLFLNADKCAYAVAISYWYLVRTRYPYIKGGNSFFLSIVFICCIHVCTYARSIKNIRFSNCMLRWSINLV